MTFITITSIMLFSKSLSAQNTLTGTLKKSSEEVISLYRILGEKRALMATDTTDKDGYFSFELPKSFSPGMLLLKTSEGAGIGLIYNDENIELLIEDFQTPDSIQFRKSNENTIWLTYQKVKSKVVQKQNLLIPILQQYPQNTKYYNRSLLEYKKLQHRLDHFIKNTNKKDPHSFALRLIITENLPSIPKHASYNEISLFQKDHFLDCIDFEDTALLRTNILTRRIIDFIALYQQDNLSVNEMQVEFIKAIDQVMLKIGNNEKMYAFMLEFLLEGFTEMGLNRVTAYLAGLPHLAIDCMETESLLRIQYLVSPYRNLMVGHRTPALSGKLLNGDFFDLNSVQHKKVVLVFWSAFCPYCLDLLPKLKQLQSQYNDIVIVSIIMDKDSSSAKTIVMDDYPDFIHLYDGRGWDSPMVEAFKVFSTPSLFLLDEQQTILARPDSFEDLIKSIHN